MYTREHLAKAYMVFITILIHSYAYIILVARWKQTLKKIKIEQKNKDILTSLFQFLYTCLLLCLLTPKQNSVVFIPFFFLLLPKGTMILNSTVSK